MNDDRISTPVLSPDSPKSIAQDGQEEMLVQKEEIASTSTNNELKEAQQSKQQITASTNETELNTILNEEISTEDTIKDDNENLKSYMYEEHENANFAAAPSLHESIKHETKTTYEYVEEQEQSQVNSLEEEAIASSEIDDEHEVDIAELKPKHEPYSQDEKLDSDKVWMEDSNENNEATKQESSFSAESTDGDANSSSVKEVHVDDVEDVNMDMENSNQILSQDHQVSETDDSNSIDDNQDSETERPILEETHQSSNVDTVDSDEKESKAISTSIESNESTLVQTADGDHDRGVTTVNAVFNMIPVDDDDDASLTTNATNMSEVGSHIRIKMRHIERKKATFDLSKRASTPSLNSSRTFGQSSFNISVLSFDSSPLNTSPSKHTKDSSTPTQSTSFDVADFVQPRKKMVESMSSKQDRLDYDWCEDIENDNDQDLLDMQLKDKHGFGADLGGGKVYSVVKEVISKTGLGTFAAKIIYKPNSLYRQQKRIDNEVNILKDLRHDHILQISEVFNEGGCFVMISEYLSGGTLLDRILQKQCFEEHSARKAMTNLLSAIQHCHSLNVVHRDIHLENIMMTTSDDDGHVKLIDFGFATYAESAKCLLTQCGSPQFVAPEILHGKPYGSKVDLWSLGVVCYSMLAGFPPFVSSSQRSLTRHIKKGEFVFHDNYWNGISNEVKEFIKALLNTNPDDRYDAEQALNHPWILLASSEGGEISTFEHANFENKLSLGNTEDEIIPSLEAILQKMNNEPQNIIETILENNVFEQIVELSLESKFPVKKQAVITITTAVSNGNQSQIQSMVDKGCVEPMCKILSSSDESVVNASVHGLHSVLKAVSDHDEVKEAQVKKQMIRFHTLSKFRHMRRLASNDDIPDVCTHIVDTYFE